MKALAVIFVLFFVGLTGLCVSSNALALQGSLWTEGPAVIARSSALAVSSNGSCPTYKQDIFVAELGAPRNICMYGDERLRIGTYTEGGGDNAVVEFPYSNTMHVLKGICGSTCYYAADTDVLVTQQQVSQYGRGLVVFQHASARIKQVISPPSAVSYVFDASNPDYEMKNDAGRYIWTPSFSVSSNGKWVVAELYGSGTVVLDLATLTARQITTEGYLYGRGMDPTEELAISDDGKSVAVTGQNAGLHVFDVTNGCGQGLIGDLTRLSTSSPCPSNDLGIGLSFPNFASAHRPRFFGDGYQLELVVNSWVSGARRVTFVTKGTPIAHQLKILSLGDSFSSGEGETDDGYYAPGTNQLFDTCHVSTRAYPSLIAQRLGINDVDAKNLACSGAKISDIIGPSDEYWGQGGRLGAAGLKLSELEKAAAEDKAVDDFQPGRALQSNFIERYNPEILTIGVGGNDAGLMGKLRTCAMPGTCEWAKGVGIEETAGEIGRLFDTLGSFFAAIAARVEPSRVFIVGYPDIIDPNGLCDLTTAFLMDHSERVFIQNSVRYLNQVIHAAVDKAGFTFVDIEHSLEGTTLCSGASSTSMNSVRIGDDIAIIDALPMLKIIGAETFHPTPSGHDLMADTILANYPGMVPGATETNTRDIEPSPYWNVEGIATERSSFVADFAYIVDDTNSRQMTIQLSDGTLQPHSIVAVEVHSEPTRLAAFTADEQGGVQGSVTIPASIEEGFHTLHLLGINRAGGDIDMYQFITTGALGNVVTGGSSVGPGDTDSSIDSSSTSLSQVEHGQSEFLSSIPSVLGAQATKSIDSNLQKILSPAISYIKHSVWPIRWVLLGVTVLVVASLSTLCAILLSKRWAKPSS